MGISLVCGDDEDWRIVDLPEYVRDLVRIAIVSPDHPHAATRRHLCQHTEGSILPLLKADHPIIRCLDLLGRQGVIGDLLEVPLNPFETPHFLSISGGQSSGYRPLRLSPSWPNGGDQRLATLDFPSGPILSRVRCIALFCQCAYELPPSGGLPWRLQQSVLTQAVRRPKAPNASQSAPSATYLAASTRL